jgi:NAD(P)-dependent dehydrogenase (short-subunit alcohol dehydrogenase family)
MSDEQMEQFKAQVAATKALGRAGTPNEIARPVVFLASDDGSYVNGIELFVDAAWRKFNSTQSHALIAQCKHLSNIPRKGERS